jgi:hypothetical protein
MGPERLAPAVVMARLQRLRELARTMTEDEARARMEDPLGFPAPDLPTRVARRLEELRALDDLARYLGKARVGR